MGCPTSCQEGAPLTPVSFRAGNLAFCLQAWRAITSDPIVLDWVQGVRLSFSSPPCQSSPPRHSFSSSSPEQLEDAARTIAQLQRWNAIRPCSPLPEQFVSPFFLVPKPGKVSRFILNTKGLNSFMVTEHFKMEDLRTAANLLSPGDFLIKIDLHNAYYSVPIHPDSSRFLRFTFQDTLFEFCCMPNGLNIAPRLFTKLLRPVFASLRQQGWRSVTYLDDCLVFGASPQDCSANARETIRLLQSLGFFINPDKTDLTPRKSAEFLGIRLNSVDMRLELPEDKQAECLLGINQLSRGSSVSIRAWASLIGLLNFCCVAVAYGRVHLKALEEDRNLALSFHSGNYDARFSISLLARADLQWWEKHIPMAFNPIRTLQYSKIIFTDASLTGWGARCGDQVTKGAWTAEERSLHINVLELRAARLALQSWCRPDRHLKVLLRMDNTTAIAYINKMGGVHNRLLADEARRFWLFCEEHRLWVVASYIASAENFDADRESRSVSVDTEWELGAEATSVVFRQLGQPTIDLFASRTNSKCPLYFSWLPDPGALLVDAFTTHWGELGLFWAFPPFFLILKTLRKIQTDRATGIVIVPRWPSQPCSPLYHHLRTSPVVRLPASTNLLLSPCRTIVHPMADSLELIAAIISGRPS